MNRELDEQTWDLILCDYSMPEFDGVAEVSISAAPIRTFEGKPSGAVAIFTDITALHAQYGVGGHGD